LRLVGFVKSHVGFPTLMHFASKAVAYAVPADSERHFPPNGLGFFAEDARFLTRFSSSKSMY